MTTRLVNTYDHSNERNVYTGGQYTYQIRMMADDETITKNIRLFDSLENYVAVDGNDPIDVPRENNTVYTWKGAYKGYDVSQLIDSGCLPVIYYSWIPDLQLAKEDDPHAAETRNTNLADTSVWLEESKFLEKYASDEDPLKRVKAIAIDCSKGVDDKDFELDPLKSIVVLIYMEAPSGDEAQKYIEGNAHAYNNAYMLCTTIDVESGESDSDNFVRKDYTKVGLEEYSYDVEKKWIDDNNRDGKRPLKIYVHLLANGKDTGKVLELSEDNDWKGSFEYIPYSDKNGKIHYTVFEETVVGYSPTYKYTSETSCEITNRHTPEKIELSGQKIWVGDEKRVRPDYIIVKLYGNEKLVKQITLQAPEPVEGEDYVDTNVWPYTFTDLYKYENGEEIVYRVEEVIKSNSGRSYTTVYDGFTIKNVYHPYGDLYLSKYIVNTTPVSEQVMFEFTFVFTKTTEEGPEPVTASYSYDVLDDHGEIISGRSGTVATGQTVKIKGNETLHVKEIDEYVKYTITEKNAGGFTITSSKNLEGTISPNQTVQASITNTYSATGSVQLEAVKKLYNKTLKRAKFSFNVYQLTKNESGKETKTIIKQASNEEVSHVELREDGTVDYSTANVFFGAINYTEADAGKSFTYYVEEVVEDKDGYTYSTELYSVVVTVEDKGDGTLIIGKTYYKNGTKVDKPLFENIYSASGSITLYAWKNLKGRDLRENEFTFELYDEKGKLVETKQNDENGTVAFTTFNYTEKDIGKTFYYVIHETKGSDNTVIYAKDYFAYKIEIQDYENGQLNIIETLVKVEVAVDEEGNLVTYEDGRLKFTFPVEPKKDEQGNIVHDEDGNIVYVNKEGDLPVFVNKLEPGSLSITKLIHEDSQTYDSTQAFVFHVKLIGEDIEDGTLVFDDETGVYRYVKPTDDTSGNGTTSGGDNTGNSVIQVKNGEFSITLLGGEKVIITNLPSGTSYQIWEDTPDGWILVEEKNSSGIIIPLQTQKAEFTNMYNPNATAVRFHGTKMLDNTVAEKNQFTFELYEVTDDGEVLIDTVKTSEGGFIQFKRIDYTKDNIGTHKYIIRETAFTDDSIDYDTHEEEVEVFVTEKDDKLISRVTYDTDGVKFVNKKRPGLLRLTKVGVGVNDANKNDKFKFKITFRNEAGMPISDQIYWYIEGNTGTFGSGTETGDTGSTGGGNGGEARRLIGNPLSLEFLKTNIGPFKEDGDEDAPGFHVDDNDPIMMAGNAYAIIYPNGSGSNNMLFFRSTETYANGSTQTVTINEVQYRGTVYVVDEDNSKFSPTWRGSLGTVKEVSIAEGVAIKPLTTRGWFSPTNESMGSSSTTGIVKFDLSRLDTSEVTSMQFMFKDCKNLQMLDLSTFDTRKVTNMDGMFANCLKLASLDVSSFRTPVLEIMRWTFHSCQSLVSLDLSSFNTGNVFTFESCFKDMRALKILDIRNFDISKAGNYAGAVNTHSSYHGSYFSSVFESSNAIEYIVLGPNFRFSGGGNTSVLPTPSSQSPYNGTWVRIDRQYGPYTSSQLASNYSSAMAGVWVWNTDDTGSIIYYDANSGFTSTTSTRVLSMDYSITMPDYPDVRKPGYTIGGWNTKADGSGTSFEPGKTYTYSQIGTRIGEVIILYAQWNKGDYWKYTVRHYKEKLDGSGFDLAVTEVLYTKPVPSTENPDQLVAIVTPPVKTEYANEGFSLPDLQTVSVKKDGTTFVDYYYSKHRYEIVFDGNGATSGGMENLKMQTGIAKDLPMNTYQKEGAMFTGWNTKADGSGDSFSDGQQVKNLTTEKTITLYAQWLKNDNVPLDPTFGSVTVTLLAGQTIVIPNLPNGTTYEIEEIEVPDGWELKEIENEKGTIISNHSAQAVATNKYQATGEAYIVAHKKLVDGEIADGQFSFELRDLKGRVLQTKTNGEVDNKPYLLDENGEVIKDENGNPKENPYYGYAIVVFDPISYDMAGIYNYTVKEVRGNDSNISYDDSSFNVTVVAKDVGKGRLSCEVKYEDNREPMFVNTYMPGRLKITKEILSGDQNQKFTFVVHLYDENGKELEGTFRANIVRNVLTEETYYSHTKSVDEQGNLTNEPINREGGSEHYVSVTNATKAVVELKYGNPKEYTYMTINGTYNYGVENLGEIGTATLTIPREQFVNKPGERGEFIRFETGSKKDWEGYGYYAKITATYVRGGKMAIEEFSSGDTITLTPYDTYEITGIPAGTTYTVEETPIPLNWELVSSENTSGTIVSNQTANVKFTNKYTEVLFADLIIEKELDTWENGSPVTFIFDVVVENNGEVIYADVHSLTYNGPGKKRIVIKDLPKGANVTVKEVYAGAGYKITGDATCTLVIDPDKLENKASFTNTYDNKRKRGYGAQNTFTTEDGDTWTWVSDLEEGGEGHE